MFDDVIEVQFDLRTQEARELARRATLAPPDAEGPEPAASTVAMEEPRPVIDDPDIQPGPNTNAPSPEDPQVP